ncbi:D-2-hydroxyacid dehydrogenase [Staphylospora marina]|uniref:D-2-hydroxyacid dehydrogenase n=1 Tax=Staphylospora marina TaxID=2490858 RepID=UPI0019CF548C|nr:D-2-hydroxyacid dehydrogenase [Staphylospora marina]
MIHCVSTAKMSDRHRKALREEFPGLRFSFFENIAQAENVLPDADILVTYGEDLTDGIIERCGKLKWIQVISAGLELMPFDAIRNRGILVTNARGIHAVPMSEYVMAVLLQIVRKTDEFMKNRRNAAWDRSIRVGELFGSTLGIVGTGAIGRAVAEKAKVFGMRTIGVNSSGTPQPHIDEILPASRLDELLSRSDFVVLTVPLTPRTEKLIGARELKWMKPTAWLINVARGAVTDEAALVDALRERTIAGAVLDVFTQEPLPQDHPFWKMDNVILTPHISGRSPMYMTRALEIFRHNLKVWLRGEGEWVNRIDPEKGY